MALTTRARLYTPIRDEKGDLLRYARVRLYQEDGKTPYLGKIYRDGQSTKTYPNPFVAAPALVSVYLPGPARIRLGVQPDLGVPEKVGDVIDVAFDADQTVDTLYPFTVEDPWSVGGLLCGVDYDSAYWKPLRIDHEHEGVASNTVVLGAASRQLRQVGTFPGTTTVGGDAGGWGSASSLTNSSTLGSMAEAYGYCTVAVGRLAVAEEGHDWPWADGSVALGRDALAQGGGVTIGPQALASLSAVAMGRAARATGNDSVAIGSGARPAEGGVAIGLNTGADSRGVTDSIGLGTGAQYGLPGSTNLADTAVMIGAHDPARARVMPWSNPDRSQSESPWPEYASTMQFAGATVQLQRGLEWVADVLKVVVEGDVTLGSTRGLLGFYGTAPRTKLGLGDDEPGSGITALDNLIFALRDLGLIGYRTEPMMTYRAEDMDLDYQDGDRVTRWAEHFGRDEIVTVGQEPPRWDEDGNEMFNTYPTVDFDNSRYRRWTSPTQELRGKGTLGPARHYAVVGIHDGSLFGNDEGLFNLITTPPTPDGMVFMSDALESTTWQTINASKYTVDGLDQTANRKANLGWDRGPHVYRMTGKQNWPSGKAVVGGPRNTSPAQPFDRWSGHVAEIVGMDDSWSESAVASMCFGLAFKYDINQPDAALRAPAEDFLITQHDPANGTLVFWKKDYKDSYTGKVQGRAIRVPKSVIFVPFISIYIAFSVFSFRGSLVGNWGNMAIGIAAEYEVAISVQIGDLDEDGDMEVDVDFNIERETYVGIFSLNNNLTWSMGQLSSRIGFKVCRIRHRYTKVVVCINGDPPFRYADTDVKLYSTKSDGSLLLEGTTPLWGDGTFKGYIKHSGKKVARVVERSTGNVLGTTEQQERALPRTKLYADDDPEVSFANRDRAHPYESALTTLALLDADEDYRYRARHILSTLQQVCNDDGSLNESYSAVLPIKEAPAVGAPSGRWGAVWTITAVLRYREVTGDGQFLPFARKLADKLIAGPLPETKLAAVAYFAFRDLGARLGSTTGASYTAAATTVRAALLGDYWLADAGRFRESLTTDAEDLWADVMGGLFLLAIRDRARAQATIQHLKRYRVKGATVGAPHYAGPSGLIGYKPFADLGSSGAHANAPSVIDQAGTWAAVLFKLRYGEPAGDDIAALYRWQQTQISNDPTHDLYAAQFLSYSANATANGYAIRTRPDIRAAAWGEILAHGGRFLFRPEPLTSPSIMESGLAVTFDRVAGRYSLRYSWRQDLSVPASAYEASVERSTDGGSTWAATSDTTIQASLTTVIDTAATTAGTFVAVWSTPPPDNLATIYRVRIRLRNASFGLWTTTNTVSLPPAT